MPSGPNTEANLTVEFFVDDIEASRKFYADVLGFEVTAEEANGYTGLQFGWARLALKPRRKPPMPNAGRPGHGVSLILEVTDVAAAYARFQEAGGTPLAPLKKQPWGTTDFLVVDPDGYRLRFTSVA